MTFPISAKKSDTITVSFPVIENAQISFGVGLRYTEAEGLDITPSNMPSDNKMMLDPSGESYEIAFPSSFFVTIFNMGPAGKFTMRFIYADNEPDEEIASVVAVEKLDLEPK